MATSFSEPLETVRKEGQVTGQLRLTGADRSLAALHLLIEKKNRVN